MRIGRTRVYKLRGATHLVPPSDDDPIEHMRQVLSLFELDLNDLMAKSNESNSMVQCTHGHANSIQAGMVLLRLGARRMLVMSN